EQAGDKAENVLPAEERRNQTQGPTQAASVAGAEQQETYVTPKLPGGLRGPATDALRAREEREQPERVSDVEQARSVFREGIAELERGLQKSRDRGLLEVRPGA